MTPENAGAGPPFDLGSLVGQLRRLTESPPPPEAIPDVLGEVERLRTVLIGHYMRAHSDSHGETSRAEPDRVMTPQEVAEYLTTKVRWVYDHAKDLGGFGTGKMLRFYLSGIKRWAERNRRL